MLGSSPRGAQALVLAGKVNALRDGRFAVSADDVKKAALPALRHRMLLNFEGLGEGLTADDLVREILENSAQLEAQPRDDRHGRRTVRSGVPARARRAAHSRARSVPAGGRHAEQRSRARGQGQEFTDVRPYVAGDDFRTVDWHVFLRLDKVFVRLFLQDEDLPIYFLLDQSASMARGPAQGNGTDAQRHRAARGGGAGLRGAQPHGPHRRLPVRECAAAAAAGHVGQERVPAAARVPRRDCPQRARRRWSRRCSSSRRGACGVACACSSAMASIRAVRRSRAGGDGARAAPHCSWCARCNAGEERPVHLRGELRAIDCESGEHVEVSVDEAMLDRYAQAYAEFAQTGIAATAERPRRRVPRAALRPAGGAAGGHVVPERSAPGMNLFGLSPLAFVLGALGLAAGLGLLHLLRVRLRTVEVDTLLFFRLAGALQKPRVLPGRPARWWAFALALLGVAAGLVRGCGTSLGARRPVALRRGRTGSARRRRARGTRAGTARQWPRAARGGVRRDVATDAAAGRRRARQYVRGRARSHCVRWRVRRVKVAALAAVADRSAASDEVLWVGALAPATAAAVVHVPVAKTPASAVRGLRWQRHPEGALALVLRCEGAGSRAELRFGDPTRSHRARRRLAAGELRTWPLRRARWLFAKCNACSKAPAPRSWCRCRRRRRCACSSMQRFPPGSRRRSERSHAGRCGTRRSAGSGPGPTSSSSRQNVPTSRDLNS
jgi:hypothetical protein